MPPSKRPALTSAQSKVLKKAAASLDRAYAQARRELAAAGIPPTENGGTRCLAPPRGHCRAFKAPQGQGIRCARPGCGHLFSRHDVF